MLNISPSTLQINDRFFEAIALLKRRRELGGLNGFAKKYGVVLGNLYTIKSQRQGAIKTEYLMFLVRDYGISGDWLLTGQGNMFKQKTSKSEVSPPPETSDAAY